MRKAENRNLCPLCAIAMQNRICSYTYYCESCDYWAAFLPTAIDDISSYLFSEKNNGHDILSFLDVVRIKNFNEILDKINSSEGTGALKILDVGCATGLFLKISQDRGHIATGIEPNPVMAKSASEKGFNVVNGYFPAALPPTSRFDVIIFNDVFEHIPDLNEILINCKIFLEDQGILVINLPNSGGIFFRLAKMLVIVGVPGPWNRLWQVMFNTPHLHYFNSSSLDALLMRHDFVNKSEAVYMESVSLFGLWERIGIDNSRVLLSKLLLFIFIVAFYPITKFLEKDTFFSIYKKV